MRGRTIRLTMKRPGRYSGSSVTSSPKRRSLPPHLGALRAAAVSSTSMRGTCSGTGLRFGSFAGGSLGGCRFAVIAAMENPAHFGLEIEIGASPRLTRQARQARQTPCAWSSPAQPLSSDQWRTRFRPAGPACSAEPGSSRQAADQPGQRLKITRSQDHKITRPTDPKPVRARKVNLDLAIRHRTPLGSGPGRIDTPDPEEMRRIQDRPRRPARKRWVTRPFQDQTGIQLGSAGSLRHQQTGCRRLPTDRPLLVVRPDRLVRRATRNLRGSIVTADTDRPTASLADRSVRTVTADPRFRLSATVGHGPSTALRRGAARRCHARTPAPADKQRSPTAS